MANDALDAGQDGTYPFFPRRQDGSPAWSDSSETDGVQIVGPGGRLVTPMPRGIRYLIRQGQRIMVDVTPTVGGVPVAPPKLAP